MKTKNKEILEKINQDIEEYIQDVKLTNYQESNPREGQITLDLREGNIYNTYSGQTVLDEDIFHFIDETYKFSKKRVHLNIDIIFPDETKEDEKEKIKKLIKIHYAVLYKAKKLEILKTKIIAWILLGIGTLLFLLFGLLEWYKVSFVFQGIIEIFSWVFIWESCNLFVFTNTENKVEMVKNLRLFNAIKNNK